MSAILDSVLDPQRLADVRSWDASLTKPIAPAAAALLVREEPAPLYSDGDFASDLALTERLGDVDTLLNWLGGQCFGFSRQHDNAERLMRAPGRYATAPIADVFAAALLSVKAGDADECMRAMREVLSRYVEEKRGELNARTTEIEADVGSLS